MQRGIKHPADQRFARSHTPSPSRWRVGAPRSLPGRPTLGPADGLLAEGDDGIITWGLPHLRVWVANLRVLELAIRIVDLIARHVHVFLVAVRSEASTGSIRHTSIVDKPIVLPVAPAVVNVAVDVAEVAVVVTIEVGLEAIGSEGEKVVIGLIVRGAIVGVDGLLAGVYRHDKVLADVPPGWNDRSLALGLDRRESVRLRVKDVGDVRNSIPAVPRS